MIAGGMATQADVVPGGAPDRFRRHDAEPYLSPFYSPVLFTDTTQAGRAPLSHAWFGAWPSWTSTDRDPGPQAVRVRRRTRTKAEGGDP
jgi:hypothetical protein